MIRVSGQSKSRPVKAAGAEVGAPRRNQKLHAAVAKSTFGSQNVKKLTVREHFLKFRCCKNCTLLWRKAHSKVKMLKNWRSGSTFWSSDVEKLHAAVAKSSLWSENVQNMRCLEHFLKFRCRKIARRCGEKHIWKWTCTKHEVFGALFEVAMSKNSTFASENVQNTCVLAHFLNFRCRKISQLASSSVNQSVR